MSAREYFPTTPIAASNFPRAGTIAVPAGLSLRSNFAWLLTGNVIFAACQWGMIVALAKLGGAFMVGQFSLGLAIATPVLMFSNLHLRAVQATDARRLYSFPEYLQLRIITTFAALLVIAAIACSGNYERRTAMVILAVALAKAIETLSDIHYGLFQLNDRLDQTGISMMLRGVVSLAAIAAGLYLTRDAFWACAGVAVVWLAALLFFDVREGRRFMSGSEAAQWPAADFATGFQRHCNLMRLALPLGIVTTLASINLNVPRYFIHARMGERELGIFSALAYSTVALTLVSDSLGTCAIPRMSRLYAGGELAEFCSLLFKLSAVGFLLGLGSLAVAQFMGARLLTIFYSPEYAARSGVFLLLMLAAAIHCVASMLTSGLTSARCFRIQVPLFAATVGVSVAACAWWVPAEGLEGGAMAMVLAAFVRLALAAAVMACVLASAGRSGVRPVVSFGFRRRPLADAPGSVSSHDRKGVTPTSAQKPDNDDWRPGL